MLRALARAFELTILYQVHEPDPAAPPPELREMGEVVAVRAPHKRSRAAWVWGHLRARLRRFDGLSRVAYFQGSPALAEAAGRLLERVRPDLVHVAYWYTLRHLAPFPRPPFWVLDTHDVFFQREALLYGRLPRAARAEEERMLRSFDALVAITPKDQATFRELLGPGARIAEVGMGLDPERWAGTPPTGDLEPGAEWVVFYGALAAEANRPALREVLEAIYPGIRRQRPQARLLLLGSHPPEEIRRLDGRDGIRVPGTVPDPAAYLRACRVLLLPLRACSGFRTRAVEAMASGLPVVAYPEAMEGLKGEAGRHWVAAQGPEEMARRACELLADRAAARSLARAAAELVREAYTWEATYGRVPAIYREWLETWRRAG
jgi:glycosyltransferase involved in cell wall biosynthesis